MTEKQQLENTAGNEWRNLIELIIKLPITQEQKNELENQALQAITSSNAPINLVEEDNDRKFSVFLNSEELEYAKRLLQTKIIQICFDELKNDGEILPNSIANCNRL